MTHQRALTSFPLAAIVATVAIGACEHGTGPEPRATRVEVARGGPAGAPQDTTLVTGTDPASAPQDTTLDVTVSGSGFDDGSTVQLTLGGVPTEKVRTNSTRYRNAKTLIANITIAADAEVDFYDVEVTTASRKKGIGSEMFEVFLGGGPQIMVEFRQSVSPELESFFADVATLDFASAPQPVQGQIGQNSIQTKFSPFELTLESIEGFSDGKDPRSDPLCNTEWFETILDAAAANGGSITGSLGIEASWGKGRFGPDITVQFIVAIDQWEYLVAFPLWGRQQDRFVVDNGEPIILAARHGFPRFWRRELGPHAGTVEGNWDSYQACLHNSDRSNGFMDAEIWVSSQ